MRTWARILRAMGACLCVSGAVVATAQTAPPAPQALPLVRTVRAALAHGSVDEARKSITASREPASKKAVGSALVLIYEGKDAEARPLLEPVAAGDAADDEAVLELGLLQLRTGQKEAGAATLGRIVQTQTDPDTDGFIRLARAADALGDINLANSVFQRIGPAETDRADVQTMWGELFLEVHDKAEAARSFNDALKADDTWIPALIGLSRALEDDQPDASAAALEKAKTLAPKAPVVWRLTAERQLQVQDWAGAKASLDKLPALGARTLDEIALRAALAYATGKPADVEPLAAEAAALNPSSFVVLRAAAAQAAQLYRFDDAVTLAQRAAKLDEDAAGPAADLGAYLLRTGDETRAREFLEKAFKADPYDILTFNELKMLDDLDKFAVVNVPGDGADGGMIFKFPADEAAALAPYAIPLAKQAYAEYVQRYGFTPKGPIIIEIFDQHDSFAVRTIGLPGIVGALGACFGRVIAMDSPKARTPLDFSWQATLWHEMAHVFTLQLSDYRVPRWLTEGLSQYEEHRHSAPWGRELTMSYARLLAQGETFSLKKLSESFKTNRIAMGYFEASLLAEHLEQLGGTAALRTLLTAYAGGATDTEAFTKAFGKDVPGVEASFRSFIDERFGALRDALKNPPALADDSDLAQLKARADANPKSYVAQMTLADALKQAQLLPEAKKPLLIAAELAPPAGGDDGPFADLAELAVQQGDKAEARAMLVHRLNYDHDNPATARSLLTLALDASTAANGKDAGAERDVDFALTRIADLDPFDADAHSLLGRRLLAKKDAERAMTEFTVALALGPANQAEAHTDLGEAYLQLGRKDDAKREAFKALEMAPTFARAQDLLLAAIGKSGGPADLTGKDGGRADAPTEVRR